MTISQAKLMTLYPRLVEARVRQALADTRVVLLSGPRQAGKTTLAKRIASTPLVTEDGRFITTRDGRRITTEGTPFFSMDDVTTLDAAQRDPVGFIRGIDRAIIDEVQRVPELLLAIKESVDTDGRPSRFLLTGSANLMTVPRVADSLAGRMEVVRLLPLAQSELRNVSPVFLAQVFQGMVPAVDHATTGDDLVAMVLAGGYPEAIQRSSWERRRSWYREYVDALIQRDVRDIARIDQMQYMPRVLHMLAHQSGQLVNYSTLGAQLGVTHVTAQKYAGIFEQLFLTRMLQPWYTNALKRLIKTPKVHFLDAGLLAAMRNVSVDRIRQDRSLLGALLETFVFAELLKLASWSSQSFDFFHFRDKEGHEVDIVIEDMDGRVVGIEVKAAATVVNADLSGLRKLAAACGDRFVLGVVLYDHDRTVPFGERLFATPISILWSSNTAA